MPFFDDLLIGAFTLISINSINRFYIASTNLMLLINRNYLLTKYIDINMLSFHPLS